LTHPEIHDRRRLSGGIGVALSRHATLPTSQVGVQLPAAAVNTTLLALAADRRAAVDVDRGGRACCRRAMQQSTDIACPPEPTLNPQQQTRRTLLQRSIAGTDR